MLNPYRATVLNALALYALSALLLAAFGLQFALGELPCPLCLLQRVALTGLAVGPILNLRHGARPSHYALSLLAALFGAVVSARQILLHIMPGDPGYGSAILGLHYYSWAFLCFAVAALLITLVLLSDLQFLENFKPDLGLFEKAAVWLIIGVTLANVIGTFVECGPDVCPDNPVEYLYLPLR